MKSNTGLDVTFAPLASAHLEMVRAWRNSASVAAFMYTDQHITADDQRAWFERVASSDTARYWVIESAGVGAGLISLTNIDVTNRRCDWAIYLGEDWAKGAGIASCAQYFGAVQCFDVLGHAKLCCEAFAFNTGAISLYEKFGFEREGVFVDHYVKNGVFENIVVLALHRDRWESVRPPFDARYGTATTPKGN